MFGADQSGAVQPVTRRGAQVGPIGVLMPELGFVADDKHARAVGPASGQKFANARKDFGAADTLAVDPALQALPGQFATRLRSQVLAYIALRPRPSARHEPALARGGGKHPVVANDGVVEID